MDTLRVLFRLFFFLTCVVIFVLYSFSGRLMYWDLRSTRRFHARTVHRFCRFFLSVMKIRIQVKNGHLLSSNERPNFLLVANHLGLIDILVHSSLSPTLFITSLEMKGTPGLGLLTQLGASLYVNRRDRSQISWEAQNIAETLKQGFDVMLFPEATSTPGDKVYPFKKTLFSAAALSDRSVLPIAVSFVRVNEQPMQHKFRDWVCWYGDISFLFALQKILQMRSLDVEVEYGNPFAVDKPEDRGEASAKAFDFINSKYKPIPYPDPEAHSYSNVTT